MALQTFQAYHLAILKTERHFPGLLYAAQNQSDITHFMYLLLNTKITTVTGNWTLNNNIMNLEYEKLLLQNQNTLQDCTIMCMQLSIAIAKQEGPIEQAACNHGQCYQPKISTKHW